MKRPEPPSPFVSLALRFTVTGDVDPAAAARSLQLAEKNCPVLAALSPDLPVATAIAVVPPATGSSAGS